MDLKDERQLVPSRCGIGHGFGHGRDTRLGTIEVFKTYAYRFDAVDFGERRYCYRQFDCTLNWISAFDASQIEGTFNRPRLSAIGSVRVHIGRGT